LGSSAIKRYNNRDNPYLFRDTLLGLLDSKQLEYKNTRVLLLTNEAMPIQD